MLRCGAALLMAFVLACDPGAPPPADSEVGSADGETRVDAPGVADADGAADAPLELGPDAEVTPDAPDGSAETDAAPDAADVDASDAGDRDDGDASDGDASDGADATVCTPSCAGPDPLVARECGSDGCGGFCGACTGGKTCNDGQCIPPGVPCCVDSDCCGVHPGPGCSDAPTRLCVCAADPYCCKVEWDQTCANAAAGACATACDCEPSCDQKSCGDDGCGGLCGTCIDGEACVAAECVDADSIPGNTCDAAFEVGALPAQVQGDTADATPQLAFGHGACPGQTFGRGAASAEQVWRLDVPNDVVVRATLSADFDSVLYVALDCADIDGTCQGARDLFAEDEAVTFKAHAGTSVFIIVDGSSNLANATGAYSLSVEEVCAPQCAGDDDDPPKECGDDGCGYTCGTCTGGDLCGPEGTCLPGTVKLGNTCANPFLVAGVPYADANTTTDAANALELPAGTCGFAAPAGSAAADAIYRLDAPTTAWYPVTLLAAFDAVLYAVSDCASPGGTCTGGAAAPAGEATTTDILAPGGAPTWLVVDGAAPDTSGAYQLAIGDPCLPDCSGEAGQPPKQCGDDGCGHPCGACASAEVCVDGVCELCQPQCAGDDPLNPKICGDDGCGGTCGACAPDDSCHEGQCLPPNLVPGATCANAIVVDALPFALSASTGATSPNFDSYGCDGSVLGATGGASSDLVVALTPPSDGVYAIRVDADFDAQLYALADCGDPTGSCLAHDWQPATTDAELHLPLTAGVTVFVVVDGWDDTFDVSGAFELTIAAPCQPACDGLACGDDGCGGTCGDCATGTLCYQAQCLPEAAVPGNTCAAPFPILSLPFSSAGDTSQLSGSLGFGANACPGEPAARGAGSKEAVYAIKLAKSGVVTAHLDASFDSVLYVAADCDNISASCIAADDTFAGPETVRFFAKAQTEYTLVVDGWSPTDDASGAYTLSLEPLCTPKCFAKNCGSDGCGLTCGTCSGDEVCDSKGKCIDGDDLEGNSCTDPFKIFNVPFAKTADTSTSGNSFSVPDGTTCAGIGSPKGGASRDHFYRFFVPSTGVYTARLEAAFDSVLVVLDTCSDASSCLGGVDFLPGAVETVSFFAKKSQIVTVIVDGSGGLDDISGAYTLSIDKPCKPQCDGKSCGPDGCGLSCGQCVTGEVCDPSAGTCAACAPDCGEGPGAKQCGPDGCGGTCGACALDTGCVAGTCQPLNSCVGLCGSAGLAPGPGPPCHCDHFCFGFGDCCYDICEADVCMTTFTTSCE
jgi:hypothetical protein